MYYEVSLSQKFHDFLGHDHIQWHPPLIRYSPVTLITTGTYNPLWPYYRIPRYFHWTFATGVAIGNRGCLLPVLFHLGHLPQWQCISSFVFCICFVLRPFSPELVMFPDFEFRTSLGTYAKGIHIILWFVLSTRNATPGLTSGLQGSVDVHRGALLLVPQWQCISSFVFFILISISYRMELIKRIFSEPGRMSGELMS